MPRIPQNFSRTLILLTGILFLQIFAQASPATDLSNVSIIPKPVSLTPSAGSFTLKNSSTIFIEGHSDPILAVGKYLAARLSPATGFPMTVKPFTGKQTGGNIYLTLSTYDPQLGEEGYTLTIKHDQINLAANKPAGLFNGIQTLRQLFPAQIESLSLQAGPWQIPAGVIRDFPEYSYRGVMLDVARHFFQVSDVKRYIDLITLYKMNVMHLHLSDDQGWRIEIKKWPNLTKIGGSSQVGGEKGGFYTQEQYTEIVKYAAERFITIIPEIDMPGHTNAALASYPELNCNNKSTGLYTGTDVGFSSLCTGKAITWQFIADVLGEISALTPGPYLHIGGDESHVTKLEDYIPFVNHVQEIVSKLGKKVIGWDEIALSTLKPNTSVQYWAKAENAEKGVKQGAKVIMSPAANSYLDMKYDSTTTLGLNWAGYVETDRCYSWDPATLVPGVAKGDILGIEAPIWSETITNMKELEYMVFPRLPGLAELGWSSPASRNWKEYKIRLGQQGDRLKTLQINFYPSKLVPWTVAGR